MKKIRDELTSLQEFICELEDTTGYHIDELEYGPGIPAAYFEGQDNALEQHIKEVADVINEIQPDYKITLEMGRAFAAGCGYYMTEVKDIKHSDDKNYCIVNGGMHQLNYDGQIRGMYMPHIRHIRSASVEYNETDFEKSDTNKLEHNELMNTESNIKNALFFNILKYAWGLCLDKDVDTVFMIDEAHVLLGDHNALGADFLAQVQRRARKYNTGSIIITQQPSDFAAPEVLMQGKAIFDNASYYLVMGLKKQAVEDLSKLIDLNDNEKDAIKAFNQGEALFVCGDRRMQINIELTDKELESFGSGGGL